MKYLVLLIDGAADEPVPELNGKTPLETADKPYMNLLAKNGNCGMLNPTPSGCVGGSDTGNLSVMGYNPSIYLTGRSPLEAAALGIKMNETDVALRVNLVTLSQDEPYENKVLLDYSSDEITSEEAAQLINYLKECFDSEKQTLYPGFSYRHCLIIHDAKPDMTFFPPHNNTGKVITDILPQGEYSAELKAMMKRSFELLNHHPVNEARRARGLKPANSLWPWGQGTKPALIPFSERHSLKGAVVTAVDLVKGIAVLADMTVYPVEGATGTINTNFKGKAEAAIKAFNDGFDLVYLHLEAPDECGHRHEVEGKVRSLELIDSLVLGPVYNYLKHSGESFAIGITPDHPTPLVTRAHSNSTVPFVIYYSNHGPEYPVDNYCERENSMRIASALPGHEFIDRMKLHSDGK